MMHDISKKITHFFIQLNFIDESSEVWCQYVVEKKVMQALFLIITFIVAFLYNQIFETLIFCVVFCSIRERIGGWHAPYPWLCLVLSGLIISLVAGVLVPITLNIGLFDIFLFNNILLVILLFTKPSYPWQLHFGKEETVANLKKKNILVLFFGLFNLIFLVLKCRGMLGSMLWALVFSIGLLQIEVIINRKEND